MVFVCGFCVVLKISTVSIMKSNFLICFCNFYLSCPILEKDNVITNLYIVLCCLIK